MGKRTKSGPFQFPAKVEDAKSYKSGAELLEKSGVDAVIIATPVYLHPEHFEAAVRARKESGVSGAKLAGFLSRSRS